MIIYGAARIPLRVGKRSVDSEILISPDLNGLILGIDWMEKHGQFVWDFREQRIKFEDGEWVELQKEAGRIQKSTKSICERRHSSPAISADRSECTNFTPNIER